MKSVCEWCGREIDNRGMQAHVHFRHLKQYLVRFRLNWMVNFALDIWPPTFEHKQLTGGSE